MTVAPQTLAIPSNRCICQDMNSCKKHLKRSIKTIPDDIIVNILAPQNTQIDESNINIILS